MKIYRVSYYCDEGATVEQHYPTMKESIKVLNKIWGENKEVESIHLDALVISEPTKENVCNMLDSINYIESVTTLMTKRRRK